MSKRFKATLSMFLCAVMVLCSVVVGGMFANADTNTGKAIQLVKDGAAANIIGGQASNIYFGNYAQSDKTGKTKAPIKWRVLANNASSKQLFLLSDQGLDTVQYHTEDEDVTWEKSTIRSWLNGYGANYNNGGNSGTSYTENNFINTAFSADEQTAITVTNVGDKINDKISLLSTDEANNSSYFSSDGARKCVPTDYAINKEAYTESSYTVDGKATCWWWLRSPGCDSTYAADVSYDGVVDYFGYLVHYDGGCVRPAFNLNLSSVLFTSAAEGGKKSSATGTISKIADYSGNDWKVTLKDAGREFKVTESNASGKPGDTITLSYTGATIYNKDSTPNEYISVIITDSTGNAIYYGRITQPTSASGNVSITIPTDLDDGKYTLNVFSEQYNGGANDDTKLTDYASAFSAVDLTVEPYEISVNFDENSGDWAEGYTPPTSYMSNVTLTMPTKDNISRTGYTFDGWELLSTSSRTVKNYKAKWKINQYTLTFVLGNGEENVTITQNYNTNVTAPAPTRVGYEFGGWDGTVPTTMPAKNETYTAKWLVKKYTITFNTDGGSYVSPKTQNYDSKITKPSDPTKEGYTFAGWNPEIPEKMPADNMTIKATWTINQYTLTFVLGNGEKDVTIKQDYNTNVTAPKPTRVGYIFNGWDKTVPATMPADNITYTAQWLTCDHKDSTNKPTCTESAVCSICSKDLSPLGHSFDENGKCTVCNIQKIAIPTANSLTYTGEVQTGVNAGTGYTLSDNTAINAGTYTATATLSDGYIWSDESSLSKSISWSIAQKEITPTVNIEKETYIYTKEEIKPTVTVSYDGETINADEYDITYSNNIEPGNATVAVKSKETGNYKFSTTKNFTITKADPDYDKTLNFEGVYGLALSTIDLPKGWSWVDSATVMNTMGNQEYSAKYTPTDTDHYNEITVSLPVTVKEHEHNWSSEWSHDENYHWHECTAAGTCTITDNAKKGGYAAHTGGKATCTEDGFCADCKVKYLDATGHAYANPVFAWAEDNTAKVTFTCSNDETHTLTKDCNVTYKTIKAATCTEDGEAIYTASYTLDGKEYTEEKNGIVTALGHEMKTEIKAATFFKDGLKTAKCIHDGCTLIETEVLPSTIHRIINWFKNIFKFAF